MEKMMGAVKKNVVKKKFDGVYNIILKDNFNLISLKIIIIGMIIK